MKQLPCTSCIHITCNEAATLYKLPSIQKGSNETDICQCGHASLNTSCMKKVTWLQHGCWGGGCQQRSDNDPPPQTALSKMCRPALSWKSNTVMMLGLKCLRQCMLTVRHAVIHNNDARFKMAWRHCLLFVMLSDTIMMLMQLQLVFLILPGSLYRRGSVGGHY